MPGNLVAGPASPSGTPDKTLPILEHHAMVNDDVGLDLVRVGARGDILRHLREPLKGADPKMKSYKYCDEAA